MSSRDSTPDPSLAELFLARVQQDYETAEVEDIGDEAQEIEQDEELEFRLFAPAASTQPAVQKVRVKSPTPVVQEPGFLVPSRDKSYYFTGATCASLAEEYQCVAVSGEDVLQRAKTPWPGSFLPWRVTKITISGKSIPSSPQAIDVTEKKHRRAGKKKRIAIRKKAVALEAKRKAATISAAEKEAEEREKRTRRNREKKVKKKEKEKAKKAAAAAVAAGETAGVTAGVIDDSGNGTESE